MELCDFDKTDDRKLFPLFSPKQCQKSIKFSQTDSDSSVSNNKQDTKQSDSVNILKTVEIESQDVTASKTDDISMPLVDFVSTSFSQDDLSIQTPLLCHEKLNQVREADISQNICVSVETLAVDSKLTSTSSVDSTSLMSSEKCYTVSTCAMSVDIKENKCVHISNGDELKVNNKDVANCIPEKSTSIHESSDKILCDVIRTDKQTDLENISEKEDKNKKSVSNSESLHNVEVSSPVLSQIENKASKVKFFPIFSTKPLQSSEKLEKNADKGKQESVCNSTIPDTSVTPSIFLTKDKQGNDKDSLSSVPNISAEKTVRKRGRPKKLSSVIVNQQDEDIFIETSCETNSSSDNQNVSNGSKSRKSKKSTTEVPEKKSITVGLEKKLTIEGKEQRSTLVYQEKESTIEDQEKKLTVEGNKEKSTTEDQEDKSTAKNCENKSTKEYLLEKTSNTFGPKKNSNNNQEDDHRIKEISCDSISTPCKQINKRGRPKKSLTLKDEDNKSLDLQSNCDFNSPPLTQNKKRGRPKKLSKPDELGNDSTDKSSSKVPENTKEKEKSDVEHTEQSSDSALKCKLFPLFTSPVPVPKCSQSFKDSRNVESVEELESMKDKVKKRRSKGKKPVNEKESISDKTLINEISLSLIPSNKIDSSEICAEIDSSSKESLCSVIFEKTSTLAASSKITAQVEEEIHDEINSVFEEATNKQSSTPRIKRKINSQSENYVEKANKVFIAEKKCSSVTNESGSMLFPIFTSPKINSLATHDDQEKLKNDTALKSEEESLVVKKVKKRGRKLKKTQNIASEDFNKPSQSPKNDEFVQVKLAEKECSKNLVAEKVTRRSCRNVKRKKFSVEEEDDSLSSVQSINVSVENLCSDETLKAAKKSRKVKIKPAQVEQSSLSSNRKIRNKTKKLIKNQSEDSNVSSHEDIDTSSVNKAQRRMTRSRTSDGRHIPCYVELSEVDLEDVNDKIEKKVKTKRPSVVNIAKKSIAKAMMQRNKIKNVKLFPLFNPVVTEDKVETTLPTIESKTAAFIHSKKSEIVIDEDSYDSSKKKKLLKV